MRMRKKKHREDRLLLCSDYIIDDFENIKNGISHVFDNENPVFLEIGCGKESLAPAGADILRAGGSLH